DGKWFYSSGGTSPWKPLGVVTGSEPVESLRFGFFDDNDKTDVIRTDGSMVWVSYDGVTPWYGLTQAQEIPFATLLLGDLDGNHKTDFFRIGNEAWYWKKDGIGGWRRLNDRKLSSLDGLELADFDGDGRDDVGLVSGGAWGYWSGGSSATFTPLKTPG